MNLSNFIFFLFILSGTLIITYWAAKRVTTTQQFYSVSHSLTGFQNGLAIAGDFMSAASFLGITGAVALYGFDGFFYSIGFLASFFLLLFVIAEPIRNLGTFTLGDVIFSRFPEQRIRLLLGFSTIMISVLYIIPQIVAAGLLVHLMLGMNYSSSVWVIGSLMTLYVIFGGMVSASWVQIIKTVLLLSGTFLMTLMIMARFDWNILQLFHLVKENTPYGEQFFSPGNLFKDASEMLSLNLTLILGTAGLPHILVRVFTVKDARAVRKSIITSTWIIGLFYCIMLVLGIGAVALVGWERLIEVDATGNLSALLLSSVLGGDFLVAFISAIAFATILAVVTGLVTAATSSFTHDIYHHVLRKGKATERQQMQVAKLAAVCVGLLSIILSLSLKESNVTYLVSFTFAIAAATNLPLLLFTLYWKRFNSTGAIVGVLSGLSGSLLVVLLGPQMELLGNKMLIPLENPGIIAIPCGFLGAILGTLFSKKGVDEEMFTKLVVQAQTGVKR
ncbi:solute symporter family protein [Metabacillus sp. Hm71]|uniref:solute symporter family protein n=1 Tax=Metabacillus sp. Hm71 TaxID=3450743 RepID=UPI003F42B57C